MFPPPKKKEEKKDYVKGLNGYFPKTDGQQIFGKVMGITKCQMNVNRNHNETSHSTPEDAYCQVDES